MDLTQFLPKSLPDEKKKGDGKNKIKECFEFKNDLKKSIDKAAETRSNNFAIPAKPVKKNVVKIEKTESEDEDEKEDLENELSRLPSEKMATLKDCNKPITSITLDRSGARMVTGAADYHIKFFDFNGMDKLMKPFRTAMPMEGNPIKDVFFSFTGDQVLVATSAPNPKIYNRDGGEIINFIKGDPYIRDMKHTKGHVSDLTCCDWNPTNKDYFITGSQDSSIRIWDVNDKRSSKGVISIKTGPRKLRTIVTRANYSLNGKLIACACQDGSLQMWSPNSPYLRPTHLISDAHEVNTETSTILFSKDMNQLITRGGDHTIKLWDLRKFLSPIIIKENIPNLYPESNISFGLHERLILVGSHIKKNEGTGQIMFMNRNNFEIVKTLDVGNSSVLKVYWHPNLNQIFAGTSKGEVKIFYDDEKSIKGAKLCADKQPKKKQIDDNVYVPKPINLFDEDDDKLVAPDYLSRLSRRDQILKDMDPATAKLPERPLESPVGKQGQRVVNFITNTIMKQLTKDTTRDQDPREEILKHAKTADDNPYWVAPAYKRNQPDSVFDYKSDEEDQKEVKRRK